MILAINTGNEKNSIALYSPAEIHDEIVWQTNHTQSQELLPKINSLLKKNHRGLKDLKAIVVWQGPGSLTGLRVGVSVANSLAWSLNIPVIGIKETQHSPDAQRDRGSVLPTRWSGRRKKVKAQINIVNQSSALDIAKNAEKIYLRKQQSEFINSVEPYYSYNLK